MPPGNGLTFYGDALEFTVYVGASRTIEVPRSWDWTFDGIDDGVSAPGIAEET